MPAYSCPICHSKSELLDVVDFNKNCEERNGLYLPKSGRAVYYAQCQQCAFLFAPEFLNWTDQEFKREIYNNEYKLIDPEIDTIRPEKNLRLLSQLFGDQKHQIRHLDYGGGEGTLSTLLKRQGWNSTSYDPYFAEATTVRGVEPFDLITAFEVFEHEPNPLRLMTELKARVRETSIILFSTLLSDSYLKESIRLDWWYVSPRNGHCSIYSKKSIEFLATHFGFRYASLGPAYQILYGRFPVWAQNLTN